MPTRRSLLGSLSLTVPSLCGCLGSASPTRICSVQLLNWDRQRHRFHVQVRADGATLWEREASVPGRTDDVIPGPEYDSGLPAGRPVYTIRATVDDSEWATGTFGEDAAALEFNVHAEEDGDPGIWFSTDCPPATATSSG